MIINKSGHMTKMAAMPIYGKKDLQTSSQELLNLLQSEANTGEPREKPPGTPASRTWLVSNVARAGLGSHQTLAAVR